MQGAIISLAARRAAVTNIEVMRADLTVKGGGMKAGDLRPRAPGLVVAGARLAGPAVQRRPLGPDRRRRAGRVADMRQLPGVWLVVLFARRDVDGVMQPAVPARRASSRPRTRRCRSPSGARSRATDRCQASGNRRCRTGRGRPVRHDGSCRTACSGSPRSTRWRNAGKTASGPSISRRSRKKRRIPTRAGLWRCGQALSSRTLRGSETPRPPCGSAPTRTMLSIGRAINLVLYIFIHNMLCQVTSGVTRD